VIIVDAPNAWFNLGTLYQQQRQFPTAITAFQHAMASRDPSSPQKPRSTWALCSSMISMTRSAPDKHSRSR
jgi:hypothetical protein